MRWLLTAWQVARDVGLTGLGVWLLVGQARSPQPSDVIVGAALALLLPAAAAHGASLVSSAIQRGQPPSSPSSSLPSSSPASPSGAEGEGGG